MPLSPQMLSMIGSAGPGGPTTSNPGQMASAMTKVREAVQLLQQALVEVPMGTDAHKKLLSSIKAATEVAPSGEDQQGIQMTTLRGLAQDQQKKAQMSQMLGQVANPQAPSAPPQAPGQPQPQM